MKKTEIAIHAPKSLHNVKNREARCTGRPYLVSVRAFLLENIIIYPATLAVF